MTKHVHAEMIKAKADNMELVVFVKNSNTGKWWEVFGDLPFNKQQDFFLCLPQHKEACLHWLNGGDAEYFHDKYQNAGWLGIYDSQDAEWTNEHTFMDGRYIIRIKPRKDEFSELLSGFSSEEPISNEVKEELIYKLIESVYGSGFLIKFSDIKPEL